MQGLRNTSRSATLAGLLFTAACALWFVPESRSRGHIFDEAVRGVTQLDGHEGGQFVDRVIRQTFPLGTPLINVIGHIEDAGGICHETTRSEVKPGHAATTCNYESTNYFAQAYMGMGEPTYVRAENEWMISIRHFDGVTTGYLVESRATFDYPNREDYLDGIDRQQAAADRFRQTDVEN